MTVFLITALVTATAGVLFNARLAFDRFAGLGERAVSFMFAAIHLHAIVALALALTEVQS